jgi:hypothetical protein
MAFHQAQSGGPWNWNKCRRPSEASYAGFYLSGSTETETQEIGESAEPKKFANFRTKVLFCPEKLDINTA